MKSTNRQATFAGRRLNPAFSLTAVLSAIAVCVFSTGCFSVRLDGNGTTESSFSSGRQIVADTKNEIDEITPVVRKTYQALELEFNLSGGFTIEERVTTAIHHARGRRVTFGFFPGAASADSAGGSVSTALKSLWHNLIFFGTPTLASLVWEPFSPARQGKGSEFTKSSLFGFYKWESMFSTEEQSENVRNRESSLRLKDYSCRYNGISYTDTDGICKITPKPEGKTIEVVVSVNSRHPLAKQLEPFAIAMTISIPE